MQKSLTLLGGKISPKAQFNGVLLIQNYEGNINIKHCSTQKVNYPLTTFSIILFLMSRISNWFYILITINAAFLLLLFFNINSNGSLGQSKHPYFSLLNLFQTLKHLMSTLLEDKRLNLMSSHP